METVIETAQLVKLTDQHVLLHAIPDQLRRKNSKLMQPARKFLRPPGRRWARWVAYLSRIRFPERPGDQPFLLDPSWKSGRARQRLRTAA